MVLDHIGVMIVDDSPSVRAVLSGFIRDDPGLELIGTAGNPLEAIEKMREHQPDVLLLDLHMPQMDGLTFLKQIMQDHPIPTVVVSSYVRDGSEECLRALDLGAVGVLLKPRVATPEARQEAAVRIADAVRAAVQTPLAIRPRKVIPKAPGERYSADVILPLTTRPAPKHALPLIAIGASTGGTEALGGLFEALPAGLPPIAVVQHMPAGFTKPFAERLNKLSQIEIFEAFEGASLGRGQAVIAQADKHLVLKREAEGYRIGLREGFCVARHRPSVDVLFRSVAQEVGDAALGILLTGMGDDGASGMGELYATGAQTLAQDKASSVVWGMPGVAIRRGVVSKVVPLDEMVQEIVNWAKGHVARQRV